MALRLASYHDRPIGIERCRQTPHYAQQAADLGDEFGHHELNLDIAEDEARPPISEIVSRPDEGIDEIHEIIEHDPEDKT